MGSFWRGVYRGWFVGMIVLTLFAIYAWLIGALTFTVTWR